MQLIVKVILRDNGTMAFPAMDFTKGTKDTMDIKATVIKVTVIQDIMGTTRIKELRSRTCIEDGRVF